MTRFLLNGQARHIVPEPGRTVLDHLRLHERLTATKEGCAEGDCGACTIALGRPAGDGLEFIAVNSCIMMAADLDGCAVLTAEGVADGGLAPVQTAMIEEHASQCGFCTPGFVMSLFALGQTAVTAAEMPAATLDALAGNLCRCTGYRPILAAAAAMRALPEPRIQLWREAIDQLPADDAAPLTLAALDGLLAAEPGSKLTAGTTDIGVPIAKHGNIPAGMVSLRRVAALAEIAELEDCLSIGATATYSKILPYLARHFPNFAALVRRIGSVQIRNLGTMGGNVCNASPIGDSAPCLIALGARLVLRSADGERVVAVEGFFIGYRKTVLRPGEYLRAIEIPYLAAGEVFHAYKLAKRFDQDISTVAAGFKLAVDDGVITAVRAGFGGMAATPIRAVGIEAALAGRVCEAAAFAAAAAAVAREFTPLSDVRASAAYRLSAAAGLLARLGATLAGEPADIWAL